MAPSDHRNDFDGPSLFSDSNVSRQSSAASPVAVLSCSRLGMQANPPGRSFSWFRRR